MSTGPSSATPTRRAISLSPTPGASQPKHVTHSAHRHPLCWHPLPRAKAKGADPNRASRGLAYPSEIIPECRAKSSRNAERDQIGMLGDIIADSRATSLGIRMQVYARRAKLGMAAQNRCAELRLRAERKLGELLTITPRLHGRPKSVPDQNSLPSLSDLGVCDRKLSHRAQRLAAIPQRDFDSWLQQADRHQLEITTRLLLTICEQRQAAARNRKRIIGGRVEDLVAFARKHKMGCITIDPPLAPNRGWALPYMTMSLDE